MSDLLPDTGSEYLRIGCPEHINEPKAKLSLRIMRFKDEKLLHILISLIMQLRYYKIHDML